MRDEPRVPGDEICATLIFRWPGKDFAAVRVEFHRTSFVGPAFGNCIVLRGRIPEPVLEGPSASVDLVGTVPDWVRSGTYACRYVHRHVPGRGWVILCSRTSATSS